VLYKHPSLAREYGEAAKKHVHENFSEESLVDRTEGVYRRWMILKHGAES